MKTETPQVFVIDDDDAVRDSLCLLLKMKGHVAKGYATADSFLADCNQELQGCVVADVSMPGTSGIDMIGKLRAKGDRIPVILITAHGDVPMAVAALRAGALDFIEKPYQDQILLERVHEAMDLDWRQRSRMNHRHGIAEVINSLTPREREVMDLVVEGLPNKLVADRLGISVRTVEFHRASLMDKLGARSLTDVVRLALVAEIDADREV